jgi:hypothetical protein
VPLGGAGRSQVAKKTKGRDAPTKRERTPTNPLGAGKPPYVPTDKDRAVVKIMVAGGIQYPFIAESLRISPKTLQRHYAHELKFGAAEANATVVARLFKQTETNIRATEFWLTNRDRKNWQHTQRVDLTADVAKDLGERLTRAQAKIRQK